MYGNNMIEELYFREPVWGWNLNVNQPETAYTALLPLDQKLQVKLRLNLVDTPRGLYSFQKLSLPNGLG